MLAQGLANGANTLVGQGLNMLNYNRQRRDSLADYNMQNEYNKPINQVKRLTEAGISPYAQSGQSLLASAPTPRPATMGQSNTSKPLDMMTLQQGVEQVKLLKLQQQKVMADTANVDADTNNKKLEYDTNIDDWNDPKLTGILAKRKHFDLDNTEMWLNLAEYIYENVEYVEQITDKPMRFMEYTQTKYFEMVMYWTVYHFEEKIKDITKLQQFINGLLTAGVLFSELNFLIMAFLIDKSNF